MDVQIREAVNEAFLGNEDVLAVFLMGSMAEGRIRPESDIDLAILPEGGKSLDPLLRIKLGSDLSYELAKTVDLGVITSENLIYAREALLKGYPVFLRDEGRMNLIRANLLGMYIQYNLDRREVLNAYTA